jgi:hypothetical protein
VNTPAQESQHTKKSIDQEKQWYVRERSFTQCDHTGKNREGYDIRSVFKEIMRTLRFYRKGNEGKDWEIV